MDRTQFGKIMAFLSGSYQNGKEWPKATLDAYWMCLHDLDYEQAKAAAMQHATNNKWFPTVAELRAAVAGLSPDTEIPTAMDAWGEIVKQFEWPGRYGKPTFSHPAIERAVNALGWVTMCDSENADVLRGEFAKLYGQMATRLQRDQVMLPEVKQLRADMSRKSLPEAKTVPAQLPEPAEAKQNVAEGLAQLASKMVAEEPVPEPEAERIARLAAKQRDAMAYLSKKASNEKAS